MKAFKEYSQFYDSLYSSKDYKYEVEFIEKIIKKYSRLKGKRLLSLGCGTCSHDILLAKKGYEITGIDQSATMLEIAGAKIKKEKLTNKIKLFKADIRSFLKVEQHDLAMAMFNIVGYQTANDDMNRTLETVSKGLKTSGMFIFDCWYTPAVLADKPTDKIREVKNHKSRIIRITQSHLNTDKNILDINFHVINIENKKIICETKETHSMRYWSLPEIEMFLNNNGFDLVKACKFLDLKSSPDDKEWNIFIIAKKR